MLSLPPTVETRQTTPCCFTTPTQTRSRRWPCYCNSHCALGKERRQSNGAYSTLQQSYELRPKYRLKRFQKTKETWHLVSCEYEPAPSTAAKYTWLHSTRNHKSKRLEPHCQFSATRSASKEGKEIAVALQHSRDSTKEPISALPNNATTKKIAARAELQNLLQKKKRGKSASSCRFHPRLCKKKMFINSMWAMQHRWVRPRCIPAVFLGLSPFFLAVCFAGNPRFS